MVILGSEMVIKSEISRVFYTLACEVNIESILACLYFPQTSLCCTHGRLDKGIQPLRTVSTARAQGVHFPHAAQYLANQSFFDCNEDPKDPAEERMKEFFNSRRSNRLLNLAAAYTHTFVIATLQQPRLEPK